MKVLKERFLALDIFRGATVALMILVNNPGSWDHLYAPLDHAPWNGCTPTDLVFPFFLFAVGNALSFVMPRLEAAGTRAFLKKVVRRTLLIFAIGLFLNWAPFVKWENDHLIVKYWTDAMHPETGIRILGVLQRIALAYFFASLIIYFCKIRYAFVISGILLLGYWFLCRWLGAPPDPYSLSGYFGLPIDKAILGIPHMYKGEGVPFDPEGIASTLPAIVQVIFGYFVGNYVQKKGKTWEMLSNLFVAAALLAFAGLCWSLVFPLNKKIWTSSYVLYTTGLATMVLGVLIYVVEFKNKRGAWSRFFDVFGKNPLFIFVLSGFLPRVLWLIRWVDHTDPNGKNVYMNPLSWLYTYCCEPVSDNLKNGSLLYALLMVLFYWFIVYWLDRKKIYIRV